MALQNERDNVCFSATWSWRVPYFGYQVQGVFGGSANAFDGPVLLEADAADGRAFAVGDVQQTGNPVEGDSGRLRE